MALSFYSGTCMQALTVSHACNINADIQFQIVNNTTQTVFVSANALQSESWTTPLGSIILANSSAQAVVCIHYNFNNSID